MLTWHSFCHSQAVSVTLNLIQRVGFARNGEEHFVKGLVQISFWPSRKIGGQFHSIVEHEQVALLDSPTNVE